MKNNKKYTIIDKSDIMKCWKCDGKGYLDIQEFRIDCDLCNKSGKFKESHYIIVDKKNKIAIDSDFVS